MAWRWPELCYVAEDSPLLPSSQSPRSLVRNYAHVADANACLRSISVSDPAHPSEVGYYDAAGFAHGVAVAGNYAYVAHALPVAGHLSVRPGASE